MMKLVYFIFFLFSTSLFADTQAVNLDQRHRLALQAAEQIYKLSDLEIVSNAQELIDNHSQFLESLNRNYEAEEYVANRYSGLKYMILKPKNFHLPWILAFEGSNHLIDWLADLSMGRAQLRELNPLLNNFLNPKNNYGSQKWLITGHSLGGGLAQAFAHRVQEEREKFKLQPVAMEVVTFNGFGARELVDNTEPNYESFNYFLTNDPVSKIGMHIGNTYEIAMPSSLNPLTRISRHSISTVKSIVNQDGFSFENLQVTKPPYFKTLNKIKSVGKYLDFMPSALSDTIQARSSDLEILEQAADILLDRKLSGKHDKETMRHIRSMALSYLQEFKTGYIGIMDQLVVDDLRKLLIKTVVIKVMTDPSDSIDSN